MSGVDYVLFCNSKTLFLWVYKKCVEWERKKKILCLLKHMFVEYWSVCIYYQYFSCWNSTFNSTENMFCKYWNWRIILKVSWKLYQQFYTLNIFVRVGGVKNVNIMRGNIKSNLNMRSFVFYFFFETVIQNKRLSN